MLYNQPLAIRFGNELLHHIDPVWDQLDIAVAWVRASGMVYLADRLANFLRYGGVLSVIVGIDLENTTREGLQALLDLEKHGDCQIYVYHNEANSIFHPKLYLWRNEEEARLIVASNNITQSGLYTNVEAGLQVDVTIHDPVVAQTLDALASWKSDEGGLARRLDAALLAQLVVGGYVPSEAAARAAVKQRRAAKPAKPGARLFGTRRFVPPAPPIASASAPTDDQTQLPPVSPSAVSATNPIGGVAPAGTVLLMRLRKASVTDRPTQTQIPFRVVDTFFQGAAAVRSAHDDVSHGIIAASARGGRNTIKLEIPEMRTFTDPVARFERTPTGIVYETYDVGSPRGNQILQSLHAGQQDGTTQHSIRDLQRATWWRFI